MRRPLYAAAAVACSVTAGRLGVWWPATVVLGSLLFLAVARRPIRCAWRRHRALAVMGRHERWRVAMGCPGIPRTWRGEPDWRPEWRDTITPIRGEVYCRCVKCHAARALVGWEPLP